MAEHQQGRALSRRGREILVLGRVVIGVGGQAIFRWKLDHHGHGDIPGIQVDIARAPQGMRLPALQVEQHDAGRLGSRAAGEQHPPRHGVRGADIRVGGFNGRHAFGRQVDARQVPAAQPGIGAQHALSGLEAVGRGAEHPLRHAELGLHRLDGFHLPACLAVQVPPTRAVGDEVQGGIRRPFRLEDRFLLPAGDELRLAQRAIRLDRSHPQLGAIPGQVGVIPG